MTSPLSSQRTERILLQAMEEVLGEQGLRSVFRAAHTLADGGSPVVWPEAEPVPVGAIGTSAATISRWSAALDEVYGPQSGRGLALRVGRAAFPHGLREYAGDLGLNTPAFRLLPLPSKLRTFADALRRLFNHAGDEHVWTEERDGRLLVHLARCPLCFERRSTEPACHMAVGVAEEALYWLSGGKIFQVEEITCAARGDADCTLQIDQAPIS